MNGIFLFLVLFGIAVTLVMDRASWKKWQTRDRFLYVLIVGAIGFYLSSGFLDFDAPTPTDFFVRYVSRWAMSWLGS